VWDLAFGVFFYQTPSSFLIMKSPMLHKRGLKGKRGENEAGVTKGGVNGGRATVLRGVLACGSV